MTTEQGPQGLSGLVDAWSASAQAVIDLVRGLSEDELERATDLPGWTVRDIVAHLAHLESELAGGPSVLAIEDAVPDDARDDPFRAWTERGVAARRGWSTGEVIAALEAAVAGLRATLAAAEPAPPPSGFPRPGKTWDTLLPDRIFDYWMHEQDIRRATDRPGGWGTPGAALTAARFRAALPYMVGKKVRPPAGTAVSWSVPGLSGDTEITIRMDDDGRARPVHGVEPDVRLLMSLEDFMLACGGRRAPGDLDVRLDGDADLGRAVVAAMAVTP